MSIEAEPLDHEAAVRELLSNILTEQKITNLYLANGFDETLTEEDVEDT